MRHIVVSKDVIPSISDEALTRIKSAESRMRELYSEHAAPPCITEHLLHGGMYARTIRVKAPQAFASVMITPPTVLIVNGKAIIHSGDSVREIHGYKVLAANPSRKAIWIIVEDTEITAIFPCKAKTLEEAEQQFTSEPEMLCPLTENDLVTITEERACQESV